MITHTSYIILYPIGRSVRATITLYPIGRPVRATITLYPIGRPVRTTITLYPIGRPVRATITLYPIGRPVRATITLYPILKHKLDASNLSPFYSGSLSFAAAISPPAQQDPPSPTHITMVTDTLMLILPAAVKHSMTVSELVELPTLSSDLKLSLQKETHYNSIRSWM